MTGTMLLKGLELAGLEPHAEDDGTIVGVCPVCLKDGASLRVTMEPASVRCLLGCSLALIHQEMRRHAEAIEEPGPRGAVQTLCALAVDNELARANQPAPEASKPPAGPTRVALSTISPRAMEWLWLHRFPLGAPSSIDGLPGAGKSTLLAELAASVSTGRALPADSRPREPRAVLWIGHEEGAATVIRPRLEAAGADLDRVFVYDRMPSFPSDYDWLRHQLRETGAALVIIDPIDTYLDLGGGNSHANADVRVRLAALATVAEETGAAIIMVRHWRKSGGVDAVYRAAGSLAYSALARSVASVVRDPEDPSVRLIAWSKVSGAPDAETIRFVIDDAAGVGRVRWLGADPRTAENIMQATDSRAAGRGGEGAATATDAAEEWLKGEFQECDELPAGETQEKGRRAGHAMDALRRAKTRLGVVTRQVGVPGRRGGGGWVWRLPGRRRAPDPPDVPHPNQVPSASPRAPDSVPPPDDAAKSAWAQDLGTSESGDVQSDGPSMKTPDSGPDESDESGGIVV